MNKLYKYTLALAALGLTACSADEVSNPGNSDETQILLKSEVVQTRTPNTDLQKTQLASGLKVGMFVVKDDGSFKYENQAITADGAGYFTGNALYYPKEGSVSLYAYAPYNADWIFGENTFTVASDQSTDAGYLASDLLYAEPNSDENKFDRSNTTAIALAHSHKLAKVTLKFNVLDETDMTGATISVTNTLPSVTLNTTTGELGVASGDAETIKAHVSTKSEGEAASVVIVPQTLAAETPFVQIVTKGGASAMQAKLGTEVTFESGKSYTYTVNMTADAVSIEMATSVTDWVGGSDLSGKAHETEVPDDWDDGSGNGGNDNTDDGNGGNGGNSGNAGNGGTLYASCQTPAANASYSGNTYTWTAGNNNLMTVFEFANGELANYTTLTFTLSNLESGASVRIGYYIDGNYTNFVNSNGGTNFGSNGVKVIDLTSQGIDLSKVQKIAFGGQSSTGSVDIPASDMYLSGGTGSDSGSTGGGSTGGDNTGGDNTGGNTGSTTPDQLTATFGTPGGNATYSGTTYSWTGSTNNLMTMFEFANGELANYSKLTFTFSDISDGAAVRCGYYIGDTFTSFNNGYYSNGTKEIDLSTLGVDLKTVTKISFGGHSGSGSCTIKASDCFLSK